MKTGTCCYFTAEKLCPACHAACVAEFKATAAKCKMTVKEMVKAAHEYTAEISDGEMDNGFVWCRAAQMVHSGLVKGVKW